ncbi:cuticle protein 19-like [Zootermopsis nevadensis]|uniref:Adult-specific cuticular protein ACP-20 n=1 Tax=Zootermopsis nevadensis TaxID=136037 RepID=A0A067RMD4_ZOONE|nr:cuticle protein 19-like [Zootermopsis nevadensis]KDR20839.1 Adult-specific cuticular protein ACP-20 [Zootermopsis nevadensis]
MACVKIAVIVALAVTTLASPVYESQSYIQSSSGHAISHAPILTYAQEPVITYAHAPIEAEHYAPPQYEFKYGVNDEHTHDIKEQAERRIGDKVEGYYKLLEADGTTRTVHYAADKHTGFNAQVVKSGHAAHPPPAPIQKVVAAPILTYTHSTPTLSYSSGLGAYH